MSYSTSSSDIVTLKTGSLMKRKAQLYFCMCYWSLYC